MRRFVLGCLGIVLCAGCGGAEETLVREEPASGKIPYPVRSEFVHPPGTAIADGFKVAEGSWLLGTAFPRRTTITTPASEYLGDEETEQVEYGWSGLLALSDDPMSVVNSYLDQAEALGFEAAPSASCDLVDGGTYCEGGATSEDQGSEIVFSMRAMAGPAAEDAKWPRSFLHLDMMGRLTAPSLGASPDANPSASETGAPSRRPAAAEGQLPGSGEEIGAVSFKVNGRLVGDPVEFVVTPGTQLLAPPYVDEETVPAPEQTAVFHVEGSRREEALKAFDEQASKRFDRRSADDRWSIGDVEIVQHTSYCAGGCGNLIFAQVNRGPDAFFMIKSSPRS